MAWLRSLLGASPDAGVGRQDPETRAVVTTPWAAKHSAGIWVGEDRSVWLYRRMPAYPYLWEPADAKLARGTALHQLYDELGRTSRPPAVGEFAHLSDNRKLHLVSHVRYVEPSVPPGTAPELAAYLAELFRSSAMVVPEQATFLGVELRRAVPPGRRRRRQGVMSQLRDWVVAMANVDVPDLALYEADRALVDSILSRYGGRLPHDEDLVALERWLSGGTTDAPYYVEDVDRLVVRDRNPLAFDRWTRLVGLSERADAAGQRDQAETLMAQAEAEIIAGGNVVQFMAVPEPGMPKEIGRAPDAPWLMDAQSHTSGATCVSARFELEPGSVTRNRARRAQKRAYEQMDEESQTLRGLGRVEDEEIVFGAKEAEDHYAVTGEPSITNLSLLLAWVVDDREENFADYLRARYGIDAQPLQHRQYEAYVETLPCAPFRAAPKRPYSHDALLSTLAHSAVGASSELGDGKGAFMGVSHPGGSAVWVDPFAASEENTPPTMVVCGDPGAGKTFLVELLCYQFAKMDLPVFLVNPKGSDSLRSFADACGGETINLSDLSMEPGAFDPFRFAQGRDVVEIALDHITTSLNERGSALTREQTIALAEALERGVRRYPQVGCVAQAVWEGIDPEYRSLARQVLAWARTNSAFALGIGWRQREPLAFGNRLTLIEFDQELALPDSTNPNERSMIENSTVAAMRLITRGCIEVLKRAGGGVLAVDEAWAFLSSPDAVKVINGLGRKGRSMGVFLVLMTQRIADVMTAELEGVISRVAIGQLADAKEIAAGLRLARMDVTDQLVGLVRSAGPTPPAPGDPRRGVPPVAAKPAQMVVRDLKGRRGIITVEPVPEQLRQAFSTNRRDKLAREAARQQLQVAR
ncbi:MAG TPA: ATP-binding protein [Acidimicrobiales bacterium]|nr:ATP-binding protein [Acidimicrobiales bacterium]